jgi:hypothetical protein
MILKKITKLKKKDKKIIDVIIMITIYNSFIYLFILNDVLKFIFKYLSINM